MKSRNTALIIALAVLLACGALALCLTCTGVGLFAARASSSADVHSSEGVSTVVPRITPSGGETGSIESSRGTATPAPVPAAPDLVGRPQGGELRLMGSLPNTLDPAQSQDSTSARYIVEIYSGLVTFDPQLEVVPDIAESWDVSPDGTVYTFHLRRGVVFHDGTPVTADDFKFSLERSCSPATGSPIAGSYLGDIVGAQEMIEGRATELAGVRVVDDLTLEITIDASRPSFLAKLSHPVSFVVDAKTIDQRGRHNGTGPFRLTEFSRGSRIVLEANERYYREPRPALSRVIFLLSAGDGVTMYENNELDVAAVGISDLPRISDPDQGLTDELTVTDQLTTFYVGMDCRTEPFDDVTVRQAFARAIDRQRIVDMIYQNTVPAARTIVPPQMPNYSTEGLASPEYDPDAAQELLRQSRYGGAEGLPPITLHVASNTPQTDTVAAAIAVTIEESLGVTVDIEQSDWGTFLDGLDRTANGYQMFVLGWVADYPDPENFLNVLFRSTSYDNHSHYSNPEVDDLLAQADLELDEDKRQELYRSADRIILADAPVLPLYHDVEYWLTKPYVRDLSFPAMIVPSLQYAYIEGR